MSNAGEQDSGDKPECSFKLDEIKNVVFAIHL